MNLREALKADFGIDVKITGGSGRRDDPFVMDACAAAEAVRSQLDLLRGLGRGRRELWRVLAVDNGAGGDAHLQSVQIETVLFTDEEIITETRRLYFDIRAIDGLPASAGPVVIWSDPRTQFAAPAQLGWLHFDRMIDNAPGQKALNISLSYSGVGAKATVYVYDPENPTYSALSLADVRAQELAAACVQVQQVHPEADAPWPIHISEPFALQHFLIGKDMSAVGIATLERNIIKLRLTFFDDFKMRELMGDVVRALGNVLTESQHSRT